MVLITVEAARAFDTIFFLTNGGPGNVSTTLSWVAYRETFQKRTVRIWRGDRLDAGRLHDDHHDDLFPAALLPAKAKIDETGRVEMRAERRVGPFTLTGLFCILLGAVTIVFGAVYFPELVRLIAILAILIVVGGAIIVGAMQWNPRARKVVVYLFAAILVIWSLVPFYWLLNMSLMYKTELLSVPPISFRTIRR